MTLALVLCSGCRSLPWRFPTDEKVIAAREQGRLGMDSMHAGKLAEAEARFRHAVERCPEDSKLRHDLSGVLWKRGKRKHAIAQMNTALQESGEQPQWTVELGEMLLESGKVDEALSSTEQALKQDAQLADAWKLRGDIQHHQGNLTSALHDYHRALTMRPDSTEVLMKIADVYRAQGRPRRALATLDRVCETTAPDDRPSELSYLQGLALQAIGRHDDAIEYFNLAQAQDNHPDILLRIAEAQIALGQFEAARSTAERFATDKPGDLRIAAVMKQIQQYTNRLNSAVSSAY